MAGDEIKTGTTEVGAMVPEPEADGYYGEEDMDNEEMDLSFLDEEEAEGEGKKKVDEKPGESTPGQPK